MADEEFLSRKAASIYLNKIGCPVAPQTLANMASNDNARRGPPFIRYRWRTVRYRRTDLDIWAKQEMVRVE